MYGVVLNLYRAVDARAFWLAWTCIRPVDVSPLAPALQQEATVSDYVTAVAALYVAV